MDAPQVILIDAASVDPSSVIARPDTSGVSDHQIEVRFPSKVVLHELQQSCDATLTDEMLQSFLEADAADWRSRDAYLAMARAVAGIPSNQKLIGPLHWAWTKTSRVALEGGDVRFFGSAVAL